MKRTESRTPIIKERVVEALKENGITQRFLCDHFGLSPQYFSRCLKNGWISTIWMEAIGQYLDRAPEWLSGKTDAVAPGSVFRYSLHRETNANSSPLMLYMHALGLESDHYSQEDFCRLDNKIRTTIYEWVDERKTENG